MITVNRIDVMNMDMGTGMVVEVRRQGWTSSAQWRGNRAADGVAISLSRCDRRGCTAKTPRSAQDAHTAGAPRRRFDTTPYSRCNYSTRRSLMHPIHLSMHKGTHHMLHDQLTVSCDCRSLLARVDPPGQLPDPQTPDCTDCQADIA